MNMNKKQMTMLVIGVIAVVAIYFIFFKDKKEESGYKVKLKKGRNMERGESCTCPKGVANEADGYCPKDCTLDF